MVLAPEGTRTISPTLAPFKKGAFHLAMQAGVPIVPIVIRNAGTSPLKGDFVYRSATVDVEVLPPVDTQPVERRQPERTRAGCAICSFAPWDQPEVPSAAAALARKARQEDPRRMPGKAASNPKPGESESESESEKAKAKAKPASRKMTQSGTAAKKNQTR